MCQLKDMVRTCGVNLVPGTKSQLLWIPKSEIVAMPATAADNGGTNPGDTKRYDEAWNLVTTTGLGFWRRMDILIDTGQLREVGEGEIASLNRPQRVEFFLQGNSDVQQEYIDCLVANSGCMIGMIPTKVGNFHVLGDLENPVFLENYEGGTADRVGYQVTMIANTGYTTMVFDADTYGINFTPAP